MKSFQIVIKVESDKMCIVYRDSITLKADSLIKAYDLAFDIVSSTFSDDFNYTIVEIREI